MLTILADLTPASAVWLSVSVYAAGSVPVLLLASAKGDLRDAVEPLWQATVYAGHDLVWAAASARHELDPASASVRHAAYSTREMARDVAALLLLLTTRPKGATR